MGGGAHRPVAGPTLVTGASGFLGTHLCAALMAEGDPVRGLVRGASVLPSGVEPFQAADLADRDALRRAVAGVENVVHLAARVHVMRDATADPLSAFRMVNVEGTRALLEAAASVGVRRFVYISSVKAVGEANETPWTESVTPCPVDPYGVSKLEAETLVRTFAAQRGIAATILRLPLVYGAGMKGNMARLFRQVDRGFPLPLGGIRNRRSLVYAGNVVFAIRGALQMPGTETYFVSDGEDLSTPELVQRVGRALSRTARLIPVSEGVLRAAGRAGDLAARFVPFPLTSSVVARLLGSLTIDNGKLTRLIGPLPFSVDAGLAITAAWYRSSAPA